MAAIDVAPAAAIAPSRYVISAFAGTGAGDSPTAGPAVDSGLRYPYGDAVDAQGNVYIADLGNHTVEEVTPTGALSVIAGDGSSGAIMPGPATSTALGSPAGVAVGGDGTVYVADFSANRVYAISPAGTLSIVAGTGSSGPPTPGPASASMLDAPYAVAVDDGDVYIADRNNNVVEKVTPSGMLSIVAGTVGSSGPPTEGPATNSDLWLPEGVAIDSAGNLYIGDANNNVIEQVTPSGTLSVIAGIAGPGGPPTPGPATSSELDTPAGLSVDAAGNVYFADSSNYDIDEITPSGTLSVIAGDTASGAPTWGSATASDLDDPTAVASTPAGRLYVADAGNNKIDLLAPPAPVNTTPPSVSGTARVGATLTATEGSWTDDPIIYSYHWQECDAAGTSCGAIPATGTAYTLTSSEAGQTVRVVVTAQNGGGATSADAPVSGVIANAPTTTPAPATTTAPATVGVDETTASRTVRGQWAVLGGVVAANAGAVSYHFEYGPTRRYRDASTVETLAASSADQAVTATVRALLPGTVYHYRLVVTDAAGTTSYGSDETLTTPRMTPRRIRDRIYGDSDRQAPYEYRVHGQIILPKGLSQAAACRTRGTVTVTAIAAHKVITRHRDEITAACTYNSTFRLTATQLPGSGRASFHVSYAGNRQLRARQARTLKVRYGPSSAPGG